MTSNLAFLFATLSLSLTGCAAGALGQSQLNTRNADGAKSLAAPLAVGASIQPHVGLRMKGVTAPSLALVASRPEVISTRGGRLTALQPGITALLVMTADRATVLDFYHLWVAQASRVVLHQLGASGRLRGEIGDGIDFLVGESVYLEPKLYREAQELAGQLEGEWTVDPPIAAVLRQGIVGKRRLVGLKPGNAELRVAAGGVMTVVPIRVLAAHGGAR